MNVSDKVATMPRLPSYSAHSKYKYNSVSVCIRLMLLVPIPHNGKFLTEITMEICIHCLIKAIGNVYPIKIGLTSLEAHELVMQI